MWEGAGGGWRAEAPLRSALHLSLLRARHLPRRSAPHPASVWCDRESASVGVQWFSSVQGPVCSVKSPVSSVQCPVSSVQCPVGSVSSVPRLARAVHIQRPAPAPPPLRPSNLVPSLRFFSPHRPPVFTLTLSPLLHLAHRLTPSVSGCVDFRCGLVGGAAWALYVLALPSVLALLLPGCGPLSAHQTAPLQQRKRRKTGADLDCVPASQMGRVARASMRLPARCPMAQVGRAFVDVGRSSLCGRLLR